VRYYTHIIFNLFLFWKLKIDPGFLQWSLLACLLPDVDLPESLLGSLFPELSYHLHSKYGHRSVTHSVWLPAVSLLISFLSFSSINSRLGAAGIGIISHSFLDIFTYSGVQLLWPLKKNIAFSNYALRDELVILTMGVLWWII